MMNSVWLPISYRGALSVISSTNWSVWMSMFYLPARGSGVFMSLLKNSSAEAGFAC